MIALWFWQVTVCPFFVQPAGMVPSVQPASKTSTTCAPLAGTMGDEALLVMPMRKVALRP